MAIAKAFSFLRPARNDQPASLAAYFQDTVFALAGPQEPGLSQFRRVMATDYRRAEATARLIMEYGVRAAHRIAEQSGEPTDYEGAIVRLIDRKREDLGLPREARITYADGDIDRLWPGLHVQAGGYSAAAAAFRKEF